VKRRSFIANLFAAPAALAAASHVTDPAHDKAREIEARLSEMITRTENRNVEIVFTACDPDPDRIMAGFIDYSDKQLDRYVETGR